VAAFLWPKGIKEMMVRTVIVEVRGVVPRCGQAPPIQAGERLVSVRLAWVLNPNPPAGTSIVAKSADFTRIDQRIGNTIAPQRHRNTIGRKTLRDAI